MVCQRIAETPSEHYLGVTEIFPTYQRVFCFDTLDMRQVLSRCFYILRRGCRNNIFTHVNRRNGGAAAINSRLSSDFSKPGEKMSSLRPREFLLFLLKVFYFPRVVIISFHSRRLRSSAITLLYLVQTYVKHVYRYNYIYIIIIIKKMKVRAVGSDIKHVYVLLTVECKGLCFFH